MGSRRSLRFILFAFDALRLVAIVSVLSAFRAMFLAGGNGSLDTPAVAFAAPQALFPLMALFTWLDPDRYAPYEPLFAAGKVVSAAALGAWLLGSAQDTLMAVGLGNTGAILLAAGSAAILLYDLVSALAAVYLIRFDARSAKKADRDGSGKEITPERPEIVVETVPETLSSGDAPKTQAGNVQGGA